ncbi:MMPL family transporter [Kribbella amoyensis]|uniref:MMPL family transporter n=1 Tax=Kribbella amoyensis TaxID=996641 RepID=UPI001478B1A8|nr:MMPL family transporter [Kribbella amoyensis]
MGRWAARRHWWVIGGWLIVVVGLFVLRSAFGGTYVNNYTVPGSQSSDGLNVLNQDFSKQGGYAGSIVFHAQQGEVSAQGAAVKTSMDNVAKLPDVVSAVDPLSTSPSPYVSKDGSIVNAPVSFSVVPASLDKTYLASLDTAVKPARDAGLEVEYGGGAGQIGRQADDLLSEVIGLGLALLLLYLMFRSVVAAALPLVSAVFSVGGGLAILALLAAVKEFPTTAPTVATLLGLGVAIDYGLFMVSRHREQMDNGMAVEQSIGQTESTSGAAILVAGGTVVIAILGLYVSGVPFVGALGLSSAIVVAVTVLAALTLIPALLGLNRLLVLNRKDRQHLAAEHDLEAALPDEAAVAAHRAEERARRDAKHEQSAFARWGRRVSARPWPYGIVATLLLLVLAIPLLSINLGQLDAGTDPKTDSSRKAYDLIAQGFGPGANGPLTVVVSLDQQNASTNQTTLNNLSSELQKQPGVAAVQPASTNSAGTTAVITVIPTTSPSSDETQDLVNRIRDDVLPGVPDQTYVVGTTAGYVDFTEKVSARMLWLIGAVVLLAFVLLTVAFRSIVIGLKAAVLNLLSVGAAYGVIVAVFQWGWGSSLVGIDEKVPIPSFVPMLMFAIVFGLSMDYEVFLLSRVHEAWTTTQDAHRAVAIGIGATARVITTAAAIMIAVFLSFVLDDDATVKMLAVGMAVAVLIDASVVRMVLVPAVMTLLGDKAWWLPGWLDRIVPDIQLEGGAEPEPQPREPAGVPPGG